MSIDINFKGLWTYNTKIAPKERKESEKKLPLTFLNLDEYTHIHGELQIIVDGRDLPRMGIDSPDDACLGYWIEMLTKLFYVLESGSDTYTIEGGEQGKPAYKFEKQGKSMYLSVVDSMLGGKGDPSWKKVQFEFSEFKNAFKKFKENLLFEISSQSPNVIDEWSKKFSLK